mmetsp:Transcript_104633/g.180346  ORF Transcript_104633/g.180346 Transcript_104633/m.180346 type:complete len:326 (+) Transcript_104633:1903-2880(+)
MDGAVHKVYSHLPKGKTAYTHSSCGFPTSSLGVSTSSNEEFEIASAEPAVGDGGDGEDFDWESKSSDEDSWGISSFFEDLGDLGEVVWLWQPPADLADPERREAVENVMGEGAEPMDCSFSRVRRDLVDVSDFMLEPRLRVGTNTLLFVGDEADLLPGMLNSRDVLARSFRFFRSLSSSCHCAIFCARAEGPEAPGCWNLFNCRSKVEMVFSPLFLASSTLLLPAARVACTISRFAVSSCRSFSARARVPRRSSCFIDCTSSRHFLSSVSALIRALCASLAESSNSAIDSVILAFSFRIALIRSSRRTISSCRASKSSFIRFART